MIQCKYILFLRKSMKTTSLTLTMAGIFTMICSGCAEDNYNAGYNSYDNSSNYDRKMEYVAQNAVNDAASKLSTQDIKNINNLK